MNPEKRLTIVNPSQPRSSQEGKKQSQFRTESLERILGDKAEYYFKTMEKTFQIAEQKQKNINDKKLLTSSCRIEKIDLVLSTLPKIDELQNKQ